MSVLDDGSTVPFANKVDTGTPPPANQAWAAADALTINTWFTALREWFSATAANVLRLRDNASAVVGSSNQVFFRSRNGKLEVSEAGGRWKRITKEDGFYDIRDYGALPGIANKVATTAAFAAIFAEVTYAYASAGPGALTTTDGKRSATIYIPTVADDAWYVNELTGYIGSPGASLNLVGDNPAGRSGLGGSTLTFDGTSGNTLLDSQAWNGSYVRNITFRGGGKAKYLVHGRQYWNAAAGAQVGSSGVTFIDCGFADPVGDYDSILVAVGKDDNPPDTLQTSEYTWVRCFFQGHNAIQGWGVKTLVAGNTKNFVFENCNFGQLHRGVETLSGYLQVKNCNGGNISYDREGGAMIFADADSLTVDGGGMENGNLGYAAKFIKIGQGTAARITGVYVAATPPTDDVIVDYEGPTVIIGSEFVNGRAAASFLPWTPSQAVLVGQHRKNDGDKIYRCTAPGTTASSGGPTGTGGAIADNGVTWAWVTSAAAGNEMRIRGAQPSSSGWGGTKIIDCVFPYNTTALVAVPLYDGSNNPVTGALGKANTDFAKNAAHKVRVTGCSSGLTGSDLTLQLPDFIGDTEIVLRDQFLTDNIPTQCTVTRNSNGVYVITVPASAIVANGVQLRIWDYPANANRFKLTDVVMDVTTLFSGPGVSGITASIGAAGDASIMLAQAADAVATYGLNVAHRGAGFTGERHYRWATGGTAIHVTFAASGGNPALINAGSLTIYFEGKRMGV